MKLLPILLLFVALPAHAFVEEKVQFAAAEGVFLNGYLARPEGAGSYPTVILQMGSGQGTTDSESRAFNPFATLARSLADEGFVVLRFDKRGTGYNAENGSFADGTFSDYVHDLKSAVQFIRTRAEVRSDRIFLFGHSLGGLVISKVAEEMPFISGVILSATPGRSFAEYNLEQIRNILELGQGLSGEALESELNDVQAKNRLLGDADAYCSAYPLDCTKGSAGFYIGGQSGAFWREIVSLEPAEMFRKLPCPVFAIYGESDWVISSDHDGGSVASALSGRAGFTFKAIKGLDHFLAASASKKESVDFFLRATRGEAMNPQMHPDYVPSVIDGLKALASEQ